MFRILLNITLLLCVLQCSNSQFTCPQVEISDDPPGIASFYSYWSTVRSNGSNETFVIHETYQESGDDAFANFAMMKGVGNSSTYRTSKFYDFNHMQAFYVDENNHTCETSNMTSRTNQSIFAMGIENGLQAMKYFYNWHNKTLNYTLNETEVRINGIPCNHYNTCLLFNEDNLMYMVDLYISKSGYELPHGNEMPVQLLLTTFQKDQDPVLYTFTFSAFATDKQYMRFIPEPPHGIYCPDRKFIPDKPTVPEHYSVVSEIEDEESKTVMTTRTWYYYERKLYRRDSMGFGEMKTKAQESNIHDFHEGVMYVIDKDHGNCSVFPLNTTSYVDFDIEYNSTTKKVQMVDPVRFMDELHLKYTGRMHRHRGMPMDSWISDPLIKGNVTMNFTYFYSTPDWKTDSGISPILMGTRFTLRGSDSHGRPINTSMSIRYSDISWTADLSDDPYDVSACFTGIARRTYCLKFANLNDHVLQHPNMFRYKLKSTVASAANISLTRVSSQIILQSGDDEEHIYAWVTLFDVPTVHGDTMEYEPQKNITEAVNNLKKVVKSNLLTVTYVDEKANKTMTVTAFSDYFISTEEFYAGNVIHDNNGISLSAAAVAGLCVGMLLVGISLGVLFHVIKLKRSASNQFGYSSQN